MADPQTTASSTSTDDNELSGLLNQSFNNPLMKDYVGSKAKAAMLQQGADVKKAEILEQTQKPFIEQELAKRKELEPQQADIRAQMSKPFQIPQPMMADFASLGGMLAVTASMLGGAGKQPAMQAMAAMTGVLDGYQKGRKDLVDRSFKEFDANMKRLQSLQKAIDDELANYVAQMKAGKEGAALSAQTLIARTSGGSYAAAIMNQSADKTLEIGMQAQRLAAQRQDALLRIDAERDREDRKNVVVNPQTGDRGYVSSKDGKFHKLELPTGFVSDLGGAERPFMVDKDNNPVYPDATGRYPTDKPLYKPGALKTSKDALSGDASMAVKEYTGATLPIKDAKDVTQIARAMGEAELLQKDVQNNPELIGRTGQVGRAINRYVDSFRSNKEIEDDPNLSQEQLIFAKRYAAYLVQYERGIAGGAKGFTVALQQRFNNLLNQDQFNPEGFKNLMDQHITELAGQGVAFSPKNINRQKLLDFGRDIAYSANYGAPSVTVTQGGSAPASTGAAPASGGASATPKPVYLNNREIVVVNGRWVYKDTQKPVEQ